MIEYLNFLQPLLGNEIGLFVIFFVFIFIAYRLFSMITKMIMVGVVAGIFPIFANKVLGLAIPLTIHSVLSYVLVGMGIAYIYLTIYGIYKVIKYATWPFRSHKNKVVVKEKRK